MAKDKASGGKSGLQIKAYSELAAELKKGDIRSLYLFFGEEDYLIERAVRAITRSVLAPGCQDVDAYHGDWSSLGGDPDRLAEMVNTPPFLSQRRLIIIKNTGLFGSRGGDNSDAIGKITAIISNLPDFCCLIFVEEKIDKRKKAMLEIIASKGCLVQVDKQGADALCRWVATTLQKDQIRITLEAINSLVDRTENSMRVLDNEIKKIMLFCRQQALSEISKEDIDNICMPDIRGSIFQMTDAIGARKTGRALEVLDTLIAMKEPVPKIRFMLARHVRQLICAKELDRQDQIIAILKVVPFVARNLLQQARLFQMEELIGLYQACASSDFAVKTGKMEDRLSMEVLLISGDTITLGPHLTPDLYGTMV